MKVIDVDSLAPYMAGGRFHERQVVLTIFFIVYC
jgi:hypothetical protein